MSYDSEHKNGHSSSTFCSTVYQVVYIKTMTMKSILIPVASISVFYLKIEGEIGGKMEKKFVMFFMTDNYFWPLH